MAASTINGFASGTAVIRPTECGSALRHGGEAAMPVRQSAQLRETQGTGRGTFVPIVESSAASMISAASSRTMK
jgi:hypothetical protein